LPAEALTVLAPRSILAHQRLQHIGAQKEPIRMTGQFREIPSLVKPLCRIVNAVENDGDECETAP
jgi:hypothetical protein